MLASFAQLDPSGVFGLCAAVALVIQWLAFVPAWLARTERLYDLTGSATYLTVVGLALATSPSIDVRSGTLALLVSVWAVRLGSFLYARVRQTGHDGRFDTIKHNFGQFLGVWTLQGVWVVLTTGAALAAMAHGQGPTMGVLDVLGLVLWLVGFGLEVVADRQKQRHRLQGHSGFIATGLWAWSRHPNYAGEIVLWTGVALLAASNLHGLWLVTLVSPLFVYGLLTRVSGIPLLEARADARWGADPAYRAWRDATPVLWPRPPRKGAA